MYQNIKEIRWATGLSQKAFAELYGIPISTLRNWEQGSNSPAPYVIGLIVRPNFLILRRMFYVIRFVRRWQEKG